MTGLVRLTQDILRPICPAWLVLAAMVGLAFIASPASAQEPASAAVEVTLEEGHEEAEANHGYPLEVPVRQDWSFDGPFGVYDAAQLQRGLQVYRQVCGSCHGLKRVAFRTLTSETGPFLSEEEMREIAAAYTIVDADDGERRDGRPADQFPTPAFPGTPPDLSLMAKARGVSDGFRWILDAFTQYQEGGPDYIYALLIGYQDPPEDYQLQPGLFYNPFFVASDSLSMPPPLRDGGISYVDGTPETIEQYAADVSAFLMWTAEPKLGERKRLGFQVMIFLVIFGVIAYLTKRRVWSRQH